jgi:hypothetical protein
MAAAAALAMAAADVLPRCNWSAPTEARLEQLACRAERTYHCPRENAMNLQRRGYLSALICVVCIGFIGYRWYREVTTYVPNDGQLASQESVDAALREGAAHPIES